MAKISIPIGTEVKGSDRNNYRWLGAQWGKISPGGKTGQMARKAMGAELTKRALTPKRVLSKSQKSKKSAAWFKAKVGESARGFTAKSRLRLQVRCIHSDMMQSTKRLFRTGISFLSSLC